MGGSGADLEYQAMLAKAGISPANAKGYDAPLLKQIADTREATRANDVDKALTSAIVARISRPESEKLALYTGTAPVWTVNVASQIAGGIIRSPRRASVGGVTNVDILNDPAYRYVTTIAETYGSVYPDYSFVKAGLLTGGSSQAAYWPHRISFYYDGQAFELFTKAGSATYQLRLRIDGRLVTEDLTQVAAGLSAGTPYYIKCDLGSQSMRLIEIEGPGDTLPFGGIVAEPTAIVTRGPAPSLRVAALTDSIGGGAGSYTRFSSWVGMLERLMGGDVAMVNLGIGGTGWSTSVGVSDFITRLPDIVAAKPDILLVQGEVNDRTQTSAQLQALVKSFIVALQNVLPKTLLVVVGAYWPRTPDLLAMQHDAAMRAACAMYSVPFISLVDPTDATVAGSGVPVWASGVTYQQGDVVLDANGAPQSCIIFHTSTGAALDQTKFRATAVIFGTGKSGSPVGDGNADVMVSSDGTHPTPRGCVLLGRYIYYRLAAHLNINTLLRLRS